MGKRLEKCPLAKEIEMGV